MGGYSRQETNEEFGVGVFWGIVGEGLLALGLFFGGWLVGYTPSILLFLITIPIQLVLYFVVAWYQERDHRKRINDLDV